MINSLSQVFVPPKQHISKSKNLLGILFKSIFGGILIGLACIVSSKLDYPYLIFPVGLVAITYSKTLLYTGCVGHNKLTKYPLYIILLGNIIGCIICLLAINYIGDANVIREIGHAKYSESWLTCIISSIFCGMLMCVATSLNNNKHFLCIFICVAAFVLCGLDHSIANTFYILSYKIDFKSICNIIIAVVGNTIGAKILYSVYNVRVNLQ